MKIESLDVNASNSPIKSNNTKTSELKQTYNPELSSKELTKDSVKENEKKSSSVLETGKKEKTISEKNVIDMIEKANKAVSGANKKFEYSIHEQTKQIIVRVMDSNTNELIREIPSEKVLDMIANMWEFAGIVVDERR